MTAAGSDHRVTVVVAQTLQNAPVIVSAFDHVGASAPVGFTLAACCAMVENESGGRMIWGADPWNQAAYPKGAALDPSLHEQPVTEQNYHVYRWRRNGGMQPQGCGITQLTSESLQVAAELAGGCWVPFYNCRIGFAFLRSLFEREGGELGGFAAYNGSGPAAWDYARRAVQLAADWQQRFDVALR